MCKISVVPGLVISYVITLLVGAALVVGALKLAALLATVPL